MLRLRLAAAVLLLAAALVGQGVVLPARARQVPGAAVDRWLLYGASGANEARAQYLFDAADLPSASVVFRALRVRRSASVGVTLPATTMQLALSLSASPRGWAGASATFAANHGPGPVQVHAGPVSLPASGPTAPPAPWQAPIPLQTPFVWPGARNGSLVVDATVRASTAGQSWLLEAFEPTPPSRATEWDPSRCLHSGGAFNNQLAFEAPELGATFFVDHLGLPGNVPSFVLSVVVLGLRGRGGTYAGVPLPVDPARFGVPTRPGCELAIDVVARLPVFYRTGSQRNGGALLMPRLRVPPDPGLSGSVFFTQPLSLDTDPTTGRAQLYTGWANRWTVGPLGGVPAATVVSPGDAAAPAGTVHLRRAAVLALEP